MFSYTADKEIRTDDLCLDVSRLNGPVVMLKCHHMKGNQMFEYDAEVGSVALFRNQIIQNKGSKASGHSFPLFLNLTFVPLPVKR